MATGIPNTVSEDKTLTAAIPHKNPHKKFPSSGIELVYLNKENKNQVLKPIYSSFTQIEEASESLSKKTIGENDLVLCDNLYGLHNLLFSNKKVDLIYMDPPYNTGADFHSRNLEHAYNDADSLADYLENLRVRLILMREILSDTGSIYVHIGHQMLAHVKIIMDEVFGFENFKNIITRRKCSSKNFTKYQYPNLNDFVLFYTKTDNYIWNKPGELATEEWIDKEYPKADEKGRYKLVPIHAPGTRNGETGKAWREKLPPKGKHWQYKPETLDQLDSEGLIYWSKNGNPRKKVYLESGKKNPITDYWSDFRDAHHQSINITGYPTEKNLDMLKLIIDASTNKNALVLDPYCGSGTTLQAAQELGRNWIGMDQSFTAIKYSLNRLKNGVFPMGDFVNKTAISQIKINLTNFSYRFLVDNDVLLKFRDEVISLVKN